MFKQIWLFEDYLENTSGESSEMRLNLWKACCNFLKCVIVHNVIF